MGGGFPADCGRKNTGFSTPFRAVFGIKIRHRVEPMACWEDRVLVDKTIGRLSKVANNGIILISYIGVYYNEYLALIFC